MSSTTGQAAITTVASKVADGEQTANSFVYLRVAAGGADIWWGYTSGVSPTTGVLQPAGGGINVPCEPGEAVYAVTASGAATVYWARSRNAVRVG